jgi:hypothetical protein
MIKRINLFYSIVPTFLTLVLMFGVIQDFALDIKIFTDHLNRYFISYLLNRAESAVLFTVAILSSKIIF